MPGVRARGGAAPRSAGGEGRRPVARRAAGAARRPVDASVTGGAAAGRLAEIQRSRLLAGAVGAIEELGYAQATVAHITARARVSRRTFYELFDNREECLSALIDGVVRTLEDEIAAASLAELPWRERIRGGLRLILRFFDREPALARVCVVEAMRGGAEVLERREQILARLVGAIDEGRGEGTRGEQCTTLTAEGLVGAAFGILYARVLRGERAPLTGLLGELMSMIVLPYLGPAAARRELARVESASAIAASRATARPPSDRDPLQDVPMRLTYRTTRVLQCIAGRPAINNRAVAAEAGIADQGQVSKLLARLERLGLTVNTSAGHAKGEPNAWRLTVLGEQVAQRLQMDTRNEKGAA